MISSPANSVVCASNLQVAVAVVARLGLPLHPQKCLGPAYCMVVLGIELDTAAQIACLPADKFSALQEALSYWSTRKSCTKKDLQSLIGRLHHACMVVWPGRTFPRQMIDLLSCFHNDSHPIRLNAEFRKDLAWWVEFFGQWNGISFFPPLTLCLTFLLVLMHLVLLVMALLWTTNGLMAGALLSNFHCPSLTRNFFRLFWQPMFGVLVGPAGVSCFTSITKLLFIFRPFILKHHRPRSFQSSSLLSS